MDILDLIFPKSCLGCKKEGVYVCKSCLEKVPEAGWHSGNTFSIWQYRGVIKSAILALKYRYSTEIAKEIATHAADELKIRKFKARDVVLVPVPLHKAKENLRGFNQSVEVGRVIAKQLNWGFVSNFLTKGKQTKSQVELKGKDRRENLKGVFAINTSLDQLRFKDKTILVFDDVYTTGSTLREVIKVLKDSKLRRVYGLTVAR